ncbi:MAG: hypothetical protein H7Y38_02750 [Armatimonadetes bacterium]|nr:hypothetical protein [Armatimonadota bacterium]
METPENKDNVRVYEAAPVAGSAPVVVATTPGDSMVAENFVHSELDAERKSLRITQIVSSVAALAIIAYTGYIAGTLNNTLQPTVAANTATGLIATQVDATAPQFAAQIKEQIPQLIEKAPDYAIEQLPRYRVALEDQIETDMTKYFTESSVTLSESFDELLAANKDNISLMLKDGQDPQATKAVGDAIEAEMLDYVKTVSLNGETLSTKLDEANTSLNAVETRMEKLAKNANLTPQEKKARRAIGILTRTIETAKTEADGKTI